MTTQEVRMRVLSLVYNGYNYKSDFVPVTQGIPLPTYLASGLAHGRYCKHVTCLSYVISVLCGEVEHNYWQGCKMDLI